MNYKNCILSKRFEIGDIVELTDCDETHQRIITKVLKTDYKYKYSHISRLHSSVTHSDPYMIWWSKIN